MLVIKRFSKRKKDFQRLAGGGPGQVYKGAATRVGSCYFLFVRNVVSAFGKNLEEEYVTWAQFEKKHDKDATLQDFDRALDLQCVETASQFPLTSSKLECDDVTIIYDDVTVADLKKPIEDSTG
nr:hypothetical protein [Tanacetum cinerariifolium]